MDTVELLTGDLKLSVPTPAAVHAWLDSLSSDQMTEMSPDWIARVRAATTRDPWVLGFSVCLRATGLEIGSVGFKSPPTPDGSVEIAYMIKPEHQGRGFATEACQAVVAFASASGLVQTVRAHTLPEPNASTRVLTKCGFRCVGEVIDPEDGRVWRWERSGESARP
jgi:RimJ/RimL family protein N-acetyltransferase